MYGQSPSGYAATPPLHKGAIGFVGNYAKSTSPGVRAANLLHRGGSDWRKFCGMLLPFAQGGLYYNLSLTLLAPFSFV